ncbi:MAG: amidohydrolase [Chloroflexi bacterium]|nr:amidohydrolase [Chloroflexota bacterium]
MTYDTRVRFQCDLLIDNCKVVMPDLQVEEGLSIAIDQGRILAIGPASQLRKQYDPAARVEGQDKLAMPGFVDAHTHLAQQLLRGGVVDEPPIIWQRILVPFESALTEQELYTGAKLACLQMAKAGITCFADSGTGEMAPVIKAAIETGMRANIARMSRDYGSFIPDRFKDPAPIVIQKTEELYKAFHGAANGRIEIAFSATSLQTTSPELLEGVAAAARQYGTIIHIHLAEHLKEVQQCLTQFGARPVEYLAQHGALGPNLLGAHAIQLSDREICMLAEHGAKPVHCPTSNLGSHGFPKTTTMFALDMQVGMGTDGASLIDLDLFGQMRLLKFAVNARFGLPAFDPFTLPLQTLFKMPTIYSAAALQLQDEVGTLEVGKKADIVLLNWNQPHFHPAQRLFPMLVMVAGPRDVNDVIIDGQVVVKDRRHQLVDEEEVMAKADECLQNILRRASSVQ